MIHPSQLEIFTQRNEAKLSIAQDHVDSLDDLKHWRDMDLLQLLDLVCTLMRSKEWQEQGTTRMLLEGSLQCDLPSSLTMMLLNTLPRLEGLLGLNSDICNSVNDQAIELPSVAMLAAQCGLGGVFTKDVAAIWKGSARPKPTTELVQVVETLPEIKPLPVAEQPKQLPSDLAITTNTIPNGRQWKIKGVVVSEVVNIQGLGQIGTFHAGSFQFKTKAYSEYSMAADQCRAYVEGVLKMLKTLPA